MIDRHKNRLHILSRDLCHKKKQYAILAAAWTIQFAVYML